MIKQALRVAAVLAAATVGGGMITAGPAQAQPGDPARDGKVISNGSLTVRYGPTSASAKEGSIPSGKIIPLGCKVRGQSVDGNNIWYSLPPTINEWVSARYVQNIGGTPGWCGTTARYTGKVTQTLTLRTGPTTAASSAGTLAPGLTSTIICKLPGQSVAGNDRWYYLTNGRWVSARYIDNVGIAPDWCV